MGFIEIPDWMYANILRTEIAALIGLGFTPEEARQEALDRMGRGFVARSTAENCEAQLDRLEYEEEMSIGGRPYRVSQ